MSSADTDGSTRVLLVEDNPMDARLIRYAMQQQEGWEIETVLAEDGEKAINMLLEGASTPDLIVLDLNLPKRDGTEVLQVIRGSEGLKGLPVAVLSSSPMDVIRGKVNGAKVEADCYFTKPMDIDSFVVMAKELRVCYETRRLPQGSGSE
jgi:chemotaxis family two-component system response regulator Rcp1